jgi:hypothetical protein
VKAFRTLALGEDDELTAAYTRFHKAIDSEAGIVRNATFAMLNQQSKAAAQSSRILEEKTERVEKLLLSIIGLFDFPYRDLMINFCR